MNLFEMSAADAAAAIQSGEISSEELVQECLNRIGVLDLPFTNLREAANLCRNRPGVFLFHILKYSKSVCRSYVLKRFVQQVHISGPFAQTSENLWVVEVTSKN